MILSFKKVFAFSVVAVLLGAIGVYGINVITSSNLPETPQSTPKSSFVLQSPPLELTTELEKTEFQLGEPITITVSLTNLGNETLVINFAKHVPINISGSWMEVTYQFRVYDENGTKILLYPGVHLMSVKTVTFDPGETISVPFVWTQWYHRFPSGSIEQATPGTYKIVGETVGFSVEGFSGYLLETPSITITIKE